MLLGVAEVEDRPAEEPELDTGLDLQAGIGGDRLLEACDIGGVLVLPAHLRRQAGQRQAGVGHPGDAFESLRASGLEVIGRIIMSRRLLGQGAAPGGVGPPSVEHVLMACGSRDSFIVLLLVVRAGMPRANG
jgi:hypothetical protein